eukprot:TRINITY_DN45_c0_g1_i1.p1 TRINITY_DN45_c0_g1~~TRINITY_DN45_c0_g1_i1.p1  ORF type:complete len:387 (+),score=91.33 TRINITY_DN45_c0_g1_i1:206-1366(+)
MSCPHPCSSAPSPPPPPPPSPPPPLLLNMASADTLKRKLDGPQGMQIVKRARIDEKGGALVKVDTGEVPRTSSLPAPIMLLEGHGAAVNSVAFSGNGDYLVSGSADKTVLLWDMKKECENVSAYRGHNNQVLEVKWSPDSTLLYTASADKTAGVWNVDKSRRIKKITEHSGVVNGVAAGTKSSNVFATVSDDGFCKLFDLRARGSVVNLPFEFPLLSVAFKDVGEGEGTLFIGAIDNAIHSFDIRKIDQELFNLVGHGDSVTSLRLDPFGSYLLSNSMDHTLSVWDTRPFTTTAQRRVKVFHGARHNFEKYLIKSNWAPDGSMITSGSADRMVYVWNTTSRAVRYKLPGHKGVVLESVFHPHEPIVASGGTDGKVYLGEIQKYGTV